MKIYKYRRFRESRALFRYFVDERMSTYAIYGELEFPASRGRQKVLVRRFSKIKVETGWQKLTGTADITLPRRVRDFDRFAVGDVFQDGDPVIIRWGYNGNLNTEFEGYLSQVSTYVPIMLTCEDEMYKLKRKSVSVSRASCTLKQLLNAVAPEYEVKCDDMAIGSVRYDNKLITEIFDDLKSKMNIYVYFRGKVLTAGQTSIDGGKHVEITIERQAADNLKDRPIGKIWVRVDSMQSYSGKRKKGQKKKISSTKGEKGGMTITIKQPNLTQVEIDKVALDLYNKAKQPGLDGDITLFGVPRLEHGMIVDIKSILYPERNGSYYVDSVVKTIEVGQGVRQVGKLGNKAG